MRCSGYLERQDQQMNYIINSIAYMYLKPIALPIMIYYLWLHGNPV